MPDHEIEVEVRQVHTWRISGARPEFPRCLAILRKGSLLGKRKLGEGSATRP